MRTFACDYDPAADKSQKCLIDPSFYVNFKKEITPINLDELPGYDPAPRALHFKSSDFELYRPLTLAEVYHLKKKCAQQAGRQAVKLIFGNTSAGVYQNEQAKYLIDISAIAELAKIEDWSSGIYVGGAVSIQQFLDFISEVIKKRPDDQTAGIKEFKRHAAYIAGLQVRSAGSIAGNIFMTREHADHGSPFPSDVYTILAALTATITIGSQTYEAGLKEFSLSEMPAVPDLPEDALILSFYLPYTRPREYVQTYRIARRVQMAHPIVNAGFKFLLTEGADVQIKEATIVYGGLASLNCRANKSEQFLLGKPLSEDTLQSALLVLKEEVKEMTIPMQEEGISTEYRLQLAENFFYKFFLHITLSARPQLISRQIESAANHDVRALSSGKQEHFEYPEIFPLSQPIIKRAAFVQASGEAKYTYDVGLPLGGLHGVLVKSIRAHAHFSFTKNTACLKELKMSLTKKFPGFKDLITVADIPKGGCKLVGLGGDDPVFCEAVVTFVGAPIGMVVADSIDTAKRAVSFIEHECITYEDLPAIISLEEAIKQHTEMPMVRNAANPDEDIQQRIPTITRDGSNEEWLKNPKQAMPGTEVVHGIFKTSSQAHFYMETMCALAIPDAYDQMTVHCSTQNPNGTQYTIARALGVNVNQITVVIEQIGGGFGGKQHRANIVAAQAAAAAYKLRLPVRLVYERSTDMQTVGKRHPYLGEYHVAYTADGIIKGMRIDLNSDAGDTYDATFAVMDSSLLNIDQAYNIETLQANGKAYRTNKASNTAFRTFGVVQAWAIVENAIEHVAFQLSQRLARTVLPEEIRYKNMYKNGSPRGLRPYPFWTEARFLQHTYNLG